MPSSWPPPIFRLPIVILAGEGIAQRTHREPAAQELEVVPNALSPAELLRKFPLHSHRCRSSVYSYHNRRRRAWQLPVLIGLKAPVFVRLQFAFTSLAK